MFQISEKQKETKAEVTFQLGCYGMLISEMVDYLNSNLRMTFHESAEEARKHLIFCMLSDVQELIARNRNEEARQLINRVKFLTNAVMEEVKKSMNLLKMIGEAAKDLAPIVHMTSDNDMLNSRVKAMQDEMGQEDGMFADIYFCDEVFSRVNDLPSKEDREVVWIMTLIRYVRSEIARMEGSADERS